MVKYNGIACITGASSGIGLATAKGLQKLGYRLLLLARRLELLEVAKLELENLGAKVYVVQLDVRDRVAVTHVFSSLPEEWKCIDVLVNNAGLALGFSKFYEGDPEHWDTMIDTNVKGLLYVTRAVSPGMIARNSGHIVNIGSIAGKEVYDKGNVYCGTKFAVDAITKSMRVELAEHGIRVTSIHPGAVETEFSIVRFEGDTSRAKIVYEGFDNLVAEDIADAIEYVVSRKPHININELVIMPQAQASAGSIIRRKS